MSLLPWHEDLAARFTALASEGRLPHALLVTGPEGWGELELADWLALHLLGVGDDRDARTMAHPDLRWLVPDGAVIKVDAVRELVTFSQGTPQSGPRKVAVVAEAHYLNNNAANALLKTLEEPPAGTHLVLATCHPGRLLPTLRSRCQTFPIRPDSKAARQWLAEFAATPDLEERLFEHGGAPVAVARGLEEGERPLAPLLGRALDPRHGQEVVKSLMEHDLAAALARWYRYVAALAAGQWTLPQLAGTPPRALMEFADEITWVRRQLVTSNSANGRLLAERLVACWRRLPPAGRDG